MPGPYEERDAVRVIGLRPYGSGGQFEADDGRMARRFDIGTDDIYVGKAPLGSSEAAAVWTIKHIVLVAGNPTQEEWTDEGAAVWDDRLTETYT